MTDFTYKLPASRGVQGEQPFYSVVVPFRVLASLLKMDDNWDVSQRSQRLVDKGRAKKLCQYVGKNNLLQKPWVIPPLIGTIDGDFEFKEVPLDDFLNHGNMVMPLETKIVLFDGQHRAHGIRQAVVDYPELGSQNVVIVVYPYMTLEQRQQAFHDVNSMQKVPSQSLRMAYDIKSPASHGLFCELQNSRISGLIEYEKDSCSGNSEKLWSLKQWREFTKAGGRSIPTIIRKTCVIEQLAILKENTSDSVPEAWRVIPGKVPETAILRRFSVIPYTVFLKALGKLCGHLAELETETDLLENLGNKDLGEWSYFDRNAEHWLYRCVSPKGKMLSNKNAVQLTYYELLRNVGVELTAEMQADEDKLLAAAKAELDDAA